MLAKRTVCLKRLGGGHASEVRFSRFLNSRRVTAQEILATAAAACGERAAGRHILAIQDTSEINFQAHAGRVKGLGPVGNGTDLGFFIHPALAVDASHGGIVGLAGGKIWKRDGKITASRRQRDTADKESQRWIDVALGAAEAIPSAAIVTAIGDRENDIYEAFATVPNGRTHLLVRAAQDRGLAGGGTLFAKAQAFEMQHRWDLAVPEKPGQPKRTATVGLGFGQVTLRRPASAARSLPETLTLSLVAVHEIDPPGTAEPVRWVLLTTHTVETVEKAQEIVRWYKLRWHIEQLFRLLKTQGFNVEESQMVEGHALMNLVTVALIAAMQTLQLTLARDGTSLQPVTDAFGPQAVKVLAGIERGLPGKTAAQSNPHPPDRLAWAAWIIARLGGWTGYASQKPPGPKTMHHGLIQFEALLQGWLLCEENV